MPLKMTDLEEPALNLVPMVDVVLQLVIFFMVGTQFVEQDRLREQQYEIELPTVTDAQPLTGLPDEIVVNVTGDGQIFVGQEPRTREALEMDLRDAVARYRDQTVVIRGDGEGPYQHVMTVLNLCRRTGVTNVQLASRLETAMGP
jgi:biopolymer transport protein ExbD